MKKILVTMTSMYIGGAERSLIGLLSAIDYTKYQVDLLLYRHEGGIFALYSQAGPYTSLYAAVRYA